jgi:hypothetical protein
MILQKSLSAIGSTGLGDSPPWVASAQSVGSQEIPERQRKPAAAVIEWHCITTKGESQGKRVRKAFTAEVFSPVTEVFSTACHAQGWGGSPHHYPRYAAFGLRLVPDYGDPLRSRYEHVDYESTCIDCRKMGRPP